MKIRFKITLLIGLLVAVSLSLVLIQYFAERERTTALLDGIRASEETFFTSVVELSASSVALFASDYTFWDVMVEFVKSQDPEFASENLETGLDTYSADEVFVYNPDAALIYEFERDRDQPVAPQLPKEAFERLRTQRLAHFFLYKEGALIEYYGATIHPTDDPSRITEPQGFFLVGKRWNEEHLASLEKLSGTSIAVTHPDKESGKGSIVSFPYAVQTWDGTVLEVFDVRTPVPLAVSAADASGRQLLLVTGSFVLLLILVYVFLQALVGRPIELLSKSIERKDYRLLKQLRNSRSEFGTLAQLVLNFSEHELVLEAKAKDDAILAAIGSGLIAVDITGTVTLINTAAEKLLDASSAAIVGVPATTAFRIETREGNAIPESDYPLSRALRERALVRSIVMCVRKDGTRFSAAVTAAPVLHENVVIGAVQDFRDISEEEAIEQAKNDFMSLVSHELRTPLTLLRWSLEKLQARTDLPKDVPETLLESMASALDRMKSLIATILDVSRIETKTFVTKIAPVSVESLVVERIKDLKLPIKDKGLKIETQFALGAREVLSDERLLGIVISSVLTNAVRYSDAGGRIQVTLSENEKGIVLAIANSGEGIPLEEQSHVFSKLFRATNAKLLNPDGTGLGLYISKSFLERLGGSISFTSEPGKETVFTLLIPRESSNKVEGKDE